MNPDTNKFEELIEVSDSAKEVEKKLAKVYEETSKKTFFGLLRPNGEPVPSHWVVFKEGQEVVVENYTFKVAHIGESYLVLEPVGPVILGKDNG